MTKTTKSTYDPARIIADGEAIMGVELGSTRIKATLIGPDHRPLAAGSHGWENQLVDGIWTYPLEEAWSGLSACFADLTADVDRTFGVSLTACAAAGFSGMMHGYLALDDEGQLLVPFRTWRNNITGEASKRLTRLFSFPVPQRWSIAHLYQAILDKEEHTSSVSRITTLAGYIHWKLTGEFVVGVGEASGMFPVDPSTGEFDQTMLHAFDADTAERGFSRRAREILPRIAPAGTEAGRINAEGARLLDPTGTFASGTPLCPPEGDAGTGMVATNSVRPRTGNVSAGTSVFAMLVLESPLHAVHPEIDLVLTPDGNPVGMAHSNNCTSDFDAWMSLFGEAVRAMGCETDTGELFTRIMPLALEGDADAGGLLSYPYISGEHVTGFTEGRPLFVRAADGAFTLRNFVRAHLFSALCAMRTGLDILTEEEGVRVDEIRGHGGFFKVPGVGQRVMAAATRSRVGVSETAGEGGAWGMALLAAYTHRTDKAQTLADYLDDLFADAGGSVVDPDPADVEGFTRYFARYTKGLPIERSAVEIDGDGVN